ncbi:MAG: hypothetical protein IPG46_09510 [Actinobacteria bacterium]|nr:hypothetical protein [Actinomycetota bacterium]
MTGWPFVGREGTVDHVTGLLQDPDVAAVLLEGPAGIGKSAIAAHVATTLAATSGASVVKVRGPDTLARFDGIGLLRPEVLDVTSIDPTGHVQAVLERWMIDAPDLVWVDDVGHLDAGSAVVLLHVARLGASKLLLTSRTGAPSSEAVAQLEHLGVLRRLDVAPLDLAACGDLLHAVLGEPVGNHIARRVLERSHGNALVIRELVRAAIADGSLVRGRDAWRWDAGDGLVPNAAALTAHHMQSLSPPARRLVDLLVIAGELEVADLADAGPATATAVDELVDADIGTIDASAVRLAHPLFAEAARVDLDPASRIERLTELIELTAGSAQRPALRLRHLRWRQEVGVHIDPSERAEGTHLAMTMFDTATAIDLGQAAIDAGRTDVALPLAMALLYDGRLENAAVAAKAAVEGALDEATRTFASVTGSLARAYRSGFDPSIAAAHEELLASTTDPSLAAFVRSEWGSALAFSGQLTEAVAAAADGVATGQWWERVPFVPGWAGAMTALGRTTEVLDVVGGLVAEAGSHAGRSVAWLHAFRSSAALLHGDLDLAEDAIGTFDELAYLAMVPGVAAVLRSETRGIAAMWRGDLTGARALLAEAVSRSDVPESEFRRVVPASFLAIAHAQGGDPAGAADLASFAADGAAQFGLGAGWVPLAQAWAQAAAGDRTGAARTAELGARRGLDGRQHHCALWCAFDCWRFVQSAASARLVIEASAAADGHWSRAFAATAQGWLDQDLDLLTTAHEAFTGIGAPRFAELVERHRRRLSAAEPRDLLAESLTRRESEVAALAARGLTNRAIAERLGLSVRTAETHLHRAMGKLGANRREDLLLHADRLDPGV